LNRNVAEVVLGRSRPTMTLSAGVIRLPAMMLAAIPSIAVFFARTLPPSSPQASNAARAPNA
jgi:hypothetical protein